MTSKEGPLFPSLASSHPTHHAPFFSSFFKSFLFSCRGFGSLSWAEMVFCAFGGLTGRTWFCFDSFLAVAYQLSCCLGEGWQEIQFILNHASWQIINIESEVPEQLCSSVPLFCKNKEIKPSKGKWLSLNWERLTPSPNHSPWTTPTVFQSSS